MTGIFADRTITAIYDSKIREYTVKYVSKDYLFKNLLPNMVLM